MRPAHTNKHRGFTIVEIMIAVAIMVILTVSVIPVYTEGQRKNNLKNTAAEIESLMKQSRNEAFTGQETSGSELPTGGYGVYLSTETDDADNAEIIHFIDDGDPANNIPDLAEYAVEDIRAYNPYITTHQLRYDYSDCDATVYDAVVLFQPPRGEVIIKAHATDDPSDPLIDLDRLLITITIDGSDDSDRQQSIEIVKATGKIETNPAATC
jgi:prepilin-type N-terminal cleavage/methylation domain-containing protein